MDLCNSVDTHTHTHLFNGVWFVFDSKVRRLYRYQSGVSSAYRLVYFSAAEVTAPPPPTFKPGVGKKSVALNLVNILT